MGEQAVKSRWEHLQPGRWEGSIRQSTNSFCSWALSIQGLVLALHARLRERCEPRCRDRRFYIRLTAKLRYTRGQDILDRASASPEFAIALSPCWLILQISRISRISHRLGHTHRVRHLNAAAPGQTQSQYRVCPRTPCTSQYYVTHAKRCIPVNNRNPPKRLIRPAFR